MSEIDMDLLANKIAEKIGVHPAKCVVFNDADIEGIKEMAALFSTGKKKFLKIVWVIFCLGTGAILTTGVLEFIDRVKTAVPKP